MGDHRATRGRVFTGAPVVVKWHNIAEWCNGNTADFESVIPGSNPGPAAIDGATGPVESPYPARELTGRRSLGFHRSC